MSAERMCSPKSNGCLKGTLYLAGNAPNSRIALENLNQLRRQYDAYSFDIETIDVLENPEIALKNGIFLTPALQVTEPAPGTLIFGNLGDNRVLESLLK